MPSPSAEFETQLELFRTEGQSAIQLFYAWDSTHAVAAKDKSVVPARFARLQQSLMSAVRPPGDI